MPDLGSCRHRRLANSLRAIADRRPSRDPIWRRRELLLYERVDAVRGDLLAIADLLEAAYDPDPECVGALHELLRDGCRSPLYNVDIHPSELRMTCYYARSRLESGAAISARSAAVRAGPTDSRRRQETPRPDRRAPGEAP